MNTLHFIFNPGLWIGYGTIKFNTSPTILRFCTKWSIDLMSQHEIKALQEVEIEGRRENAINHFVFSNFSSHGFSVKLSSELIETSHGHGIVKTDTIAWEFRENLAFKTIMLLEGFEVYELEKNGNYSMHAEFIAENYRTLIKGRLWKKDNS